MIIRCANITLLSALLFNTASAQQPYYGTKTPYRPQQALSSYQAVPKGYQPVYIQMLARHGSRGLTGMKVDLALYNLWKLAEKEQALTPLGKELGADIQSIMKANALLGYGVAGISKPGYGNETKLGIAEHTQLAQRLRQRLPKLFESLDCVSPDKAPRQIVVVTSGKDRAVDSGYFFTQSLVAEQACLASSVTYPTSLAPGSELDHRSRPAGTDRFLLYFHKLSQKQDQVSDPADPLFQTFQASQSYQAYLDSNELSKVETTILEQPRLAIAAQKVLKRLFTPAFIAGLNQKRFRVSNEGTVTYTSTDEKFISTLTGDGKEVISSALDAALALYDLYAASADMPDEVHANFAKYMPNEQAAVFVSVQDALTFYSKGPSFNETNGITWRMAQTLLDDFFSEAKLIAAGNYVHAAKLRFAHAETIIPLASLLGVPGMATPQPKSLAYDYSNNPWRGEKVAPMAANIQWDLYKNDDGKVVIRMLYNEKETSFKSSCDNARIEKGSYFYHYQELARCYQQSTAN